MEYSEEEAIKAKENNRTSKFFKIVVCLTTVFSIANCIFIYNFYKVLCKL